MNYPSNQYVAARAFICTALLSACCTPIGAQAVSPPPGVAHAAQAEGIWKAAVPPRPMRAEFNGFDPVGVAAGARIQADCSLNWIDPDHGARYCFSSGTSLQYFLDRPQAMIERARLGWRKLNTSQ